MAKQLNYLDLTKEEFWKLPRFDNSIPKEPKRKPKRPRRWRKYLSNGWLVGQYVKNERRGPWIVEWYMADTTGQFERILNKAW